MSWLNGRKTYITGLLGLLYGVVLLAFEPDKQEQGQLLVLNGLGLLSLRHGLSKAEAAAAESK